MKKSKFQQSMAAFNFVGIALILLLSACGPVQTPATPSPEVKVIQIPSATPAATATLAPQIQLESQIESARQAGYLHASYSNAISGAAFTAAEIDTTPFKDGGIIPLSPDGIELGWLDGDTIAIPHPDNLFYRHPDSGVLAIYTFKNSDERWIYYTNHSGPILKVPVFLPKELADLVGVYSVPGRDSALVAAKLMPDGTIQITPIVFLENEDVVFGTNSLTLNGKEVIYNLELAKFEEIPANPYQAIDGRIHGHNEQGEWVEAKIFYDQFSYINVSEARDVGGGAYEAYDVKGRLMFVLPGKELSVGKKTVGANEWVFAPFGIARIDGFWKEWGVDENGQPAFVGKVLELEQKYSSASNTRVLIDFVNNELLNEFTPGIMQPLSPVFTSGMSVAPGKEEAAYLMYLDAWANARHPDIRKYLKDAFGYTGGGLDVFIKAIDQSTGPNGEKRWFPMTAPNGTPYVDVQGNKGQCADIKIRAYPSDASGISMDGVYFTFYDYDAINNNPLSAVYLNNLLTVNKNDKNSWIGLKDYDDVSFLTRWGIQFVSDPKTNTARPIFVIANQFISELNSEYRENNQFYADEFTTRSKDIDGLIATMYLLRYIYFLENGGKDIIAFSLGKLCFDNSIRSCDAPDQLKDITPEKALWEVTSH